MKFTNKEFIAISKRVHGDKYDYSLVNYKNNKSKVIIICPLHKFSFEQNASNHMRGNGCPKCGGYYMDTNFFIEKALLVHKDKYDYSLVNYKGSYQYIIIICPIHGKFKQTPTAHLNGQGCAKCANVFMDVSMFKEKANSIHNGKYDYLLVDYKNNKTHIKIICPIHGVFLQTPSDHLKGHKCFKCGRKQMNTEKFITLSRKIHGDKYDYSLVDYKKTTVKVFIICNEHGKFLQTPHSHLSGSGCRLCKRKSEFKLFSKILNKFSDCIVECGQLIHNGTFYKPYNTRRYADILIRKNHITIWIEYDGIQHFEPMTWCASKEKATKGLIRIKEIDRLDELYGKKMGWHLFRIKFNDNMDEKIGIIRKFADSIFKDNKR